VSVGAAVRCALVAAPVTEIDAAVVAAARARAEHARSVLPDNPQLELMLASRRPPDGGATVLNVYGTVRQPLEIAGQRGARRKVAAADIEASQADAGAHRRRVAADAAIAYFDAVAATRRMELVEHVVEVAASLETLARAREGAGVASGLQSDLAHAARIEATARAVHARAARDAAQAELAVMLGRRPASVSVTGELAPIAEAPSEDIDARPELRAGRARIEQHGHTRSLLRRQRMPNPSLAFNVQRDGFNELVLGGGISLGLPLPAPFGRTPKAAIAENDADTRRARAELERTARAITREQALAQAHLQGRRDALAIYDDASLARARTTLDSLAEAIRGGTVDLRDAMLAQRTLLDLLEGRIAAEHGLAIASVEHAHASGRDLETLR
jgi:cobalt-zinc-cadmium efflux system outer membrane protein